jgi:hypothetical protein
VDLGGQKSTKNTTTNQKYAIATKEGKETMSKSGGEHRGRARALFLQQLSSVDVKNKIK